MFATVPVRAAQLIPGVYGYGLDRAVNKAGFGNPNGTTPQVLTVTTTADSGTGSLRDAITKTLTPSDAPRIIVFNVSGVIELQSNLVINKSYVTIAGQTAPSPGISIHQATLMVEANNVLVQHLRVRPGDRWKPDPDTHNRDAVHVGINSSTAVKNVVFDHCTFNWSIDEMASLWYAWDSVTFNQCLFAEPLGTSIHIDEGHLQDNVPVEGESLTPTFLSNASTSTPAEPLALAGTHRIFSPTVTGGYADFQFDMTAANDGKARSDLHVVVGGVTGTNRGKFKVEVRLSAGGTVVQSGSFDQYSTQPPELKSFVADPNNLGFGVGSGVATIYVRIISEGTSGSSKDVSLDLFSVSQNHAMGPLFGAGGSLTTGGPYGRVAIIGSVLASLKERGPWIGSRDFVFANNVLHNRSKKFLMLGSASWDTLIRAKVVGNTFMEGPSLKTSSYQPILLERLPPGGIQLYENDNYYDRGGGGTVDMVENEFDASHTNSLVASPTTDSGNGIAGFTALPRAQAFDAAMLSAGARPMDRDIVESRLFGEISQSALISNYLSRLGAVPNSVAEAFGWPVLATNTAVWAAPTTNQFIDPDGNGYTRIEEWLQGLSNRWVGFTAPAATDALLATFDAFSDGNANGWTPLGNTDWSITSGKYRQSANVEWARAVADGTNWTDQVVQAKITPQSFNGTNRFIALIARQRDYNNFYYLSIRGSTDNKIEIKKSVGGTASVIGNTSYAFTPTVGVMHTFRLEVSGATNPTLKAYLDGTLILNVTDNVGTPGPTSGRAAIGTYYATADFDDVFMSPRPTDLPQLLSDFDVGTGTPAGWTPLTPTTAWNMSGGVYQCTDVSVVNPRTVAGSNASSQTVQADVRLTASTTDRFAAIYGRYTDVNNCYYLLLRKDQNKVELKKLSGGAQTLFQEAAQTVTQGTWYTLRLEISGSNPVQLKGYVNGVLRVQGTDAGTGLAAGKAALGTNLMTADFDDVIVTSP